MCLHDVLIEVLREAAQFITSGMQWTEETKGRGGGGQGYDLLITTMYDLNYFWEMDNINTELHKHTSIYCSQP